MTRYFRFEVFIACPARSPAARRLARVLREEVDGRHGLQVFFDETEPGYGEDKGRCVRLVRRSRVVVGICDHAGGPTFAREMRVAGGLSRWRGSRAFLPVCVEADVPVPFVVKGPGRRAWIIDRDGDVVALATKVAELVATSIAAERRLLAVLSAGLMVVAAIAGLALTMQSSMPGSRLAGQLEQSPPLPSTAVTVKPADKKRPSEDDESSGTQPRRGPAGAAELEETEPEAAEEDDAQHGEPARGPATKSRIAPHPPLDIPPADLPRADIPPVDLQEREPHSGVTIGKKPAPSVAADPPDLESPPSEPHPPRGTSSFDVTLEILEDVPFEWVSADPLTGDFEVLIHDEHGRLMPPETTEVGQKRCPSGRAVPMTPGRVHTITGHSHYIVVHVPKARAGDSLRVRGTRATQRPFGGCPKTSTNEDTP